VKDQMEELLFEFVCKFEQAFFISIEYMRLMASYDVDSIFCIRNIL
jgi:hypothetical protein